MKLFNIIYYDIYSNEDFRNYVNTTKVEEEYELIRETINDKINTLKNQFLNNSTKNVISFILYKMESRYYRNCR